MEGTKQEQWNNKCPSHEVPQRPNQAYTIRDRISVYWRNAFVLDMAADQVQFLDDIHSCLLLHWRNTGYRRPLKQDICFYDMKKAWVKAKKGNDGITKFTSFLQRLAILTILGANRLCWGQ